jgi:hypothetical protein
MMTEQMVFADDVVGADGETRYLLRFLWRLAPLCPLRVRETTGPLGPWPISNCSIDGSEDAATGKGPLAETKRRKATTERTTEGKVYLIPVTSHNDELFGSRGLSALLYPFREFVKKNKREK